MTVALNPVNVANSISQLVIPGVTIKDLNEVPQGGALVLPVLFPQPNDFITDTEPVTQSFGLGTTAAIDFNYTLHYVFLFAEAGSGISQMDVLPPLIEQIKLILEAILANDVVTGLVDMKLAGLEGLGIVQDPSGKEYWGAMFSLRCLEFAQ
jgi:hypothetical protein